MKIALWPLAALFAAALATAPLSAATAAEKPSETGSVMRPAIPESVGFSSDRLRRLDAVMAGTVAKGEVLGMTTLVMRHGKVVAFNTYGQQAPGTPMAKDSLFRIYSMTKPITGVAMMILFEEGKWRLDDPVTRFIPEFRDLKVFSGLDGNGKPVLVPLKRPPTMRELMSHTAGFGYVLTPDSYVDKQFLQKQVMASRGLKQMVDRIATIPLAYQPGETWSYSAAVDIQGAIVERITGKTLGQFMSERIFQPLKMTDTFFQVPADKAHRLGPAYVYSYDAKRLVDAQRAFAAGDNPAYTRDYTQAPPMESGGGGLVSSSTDYARFCAMLAGGGQLDGVRILAPASVELMRTNVVPKAVLARGGEFYGPWGQFNENVGFGLDVMTMMHPRAAGTLEGENTFGWTGAAGTWFWVDPTNDLVFIGMIQRFADAPIAELWATSRTLVYQALVDPKK